MKTTNTTVEEQNNLLDEFAAQEGEYQEYRKSYAVLRILSIVLFTIGVVLYGILFMYPRWNEKGIGYMAGTMMGFSFVMILPSVVLALLLAFFIDRKHRYKDRFNKSFWIFLLVMSLIIDVNFGLAVLSHGFVPMR